ncbi:DUF5106 domain-containing protein [Flavobacterium sp. CYK-4]|uniref:TlpA family protein disulfide reductase n=1 Tax=Flavobacterium lotistagni TaxID=2709660 RepID=UPI00140E161B|nr:TlpA family protein disulfide reductase [Flavobacterium lotistagni]NHM06383.1 DUF5106 domain-containing protein [Flavobacterium lotistagni]
MKNQMARKLSLLFILVFSFYAKAQSGYNITVNLKNSTDSLAYLTFYQMDKTYIKDTCTKVKNGKIVFQGKKPLERGIYSIVNQQKAIVFDFFIDEKSQNLKLTGDSNNLRREAHAENSEQQNEFFSYIKFLTAQNEKFIADKQQVKGLAKKDSIAKLVSLQKAFDKNIEEYESRAAEKYKGTYLGDFMNLKMERTLKDIPLASNGRPDSLKVYKYYRTHYWDGANFKDESIIRNPFFVNKLRKYFETVVPMHPDSVNVEIDKMMLKPNLGSNVYSLLLAHFTSTYETYNLMGFDKVFVHMVDHYFKTGKAAGVYEDDVIQRIIKRGDKLKPLLVGAPAPELYMIRAADRPKMVAMGFENAKSSDEVTKLFYANQQQITSMFYRLYEVKADFLILVFWDVDCGHCQKEIPVLQQEYHKWLKENKDVKVYSVYTQQEGDKYLKYIDEHQLDWINVYDGSFYNNVTEKYDIYSTPVIYVLDKDKKIRAKRISVEKIKDVIKEIEDEYKKAK